MKISLCICTFNRCGELRKTLHSLNEISSDFIEGDEIIIVDNNSIDQTVSVINEFIDKLPIKYFFEATQGLSAARNKGLVEFNGDFIVFIDDDITVENNFIAKYRKAMQMTPNNFFFGGRIHVDWGQEPPWWMKSANLPMLNGLIGHFDLGAVDKVIEKNDPLPFGANFALGRELIDKVGLFNQSLGVTGEQIGRGEETEYFYRAQDLGFKGYYLAGVKVRHRFQRQRISIPYLYCYGIQKGVAAVNLDGAKVRNPFRRIAYQCCGGFYQLVKFRIDRFYQCVINIGMLRGISLAVASTDNNVDQN